MKKFGDWGWKSPPKKPTWKLSIFRKKKMKKLYPPYFLILRVVYFPHFFFQKCLISKVGFLGGPHKKFKKVEHQFPRSKLSVVFVQPFHS